MPVSALDRYNRGVRVGVFDSGLGGLAVAQSVIARLPQYDYIYLGDTRRVPYGNRSQDAIHEFTSEALDFLFERECQIVLVACNTASAEAVRRSQQKYLPAKYPDRRVLGVVVPCVEEAIAGGGSRFGLLATSSTVASRAYEREVERQLPGGTVASVAAPLLVPLVENDGFQYVDAILEDYLARLPQEIDSLILGCTHYAWLKSNVRNRVKCQVISPDEVVPAKFESYLRRHPEHEGKLTRGGDRRYCVTDWTAGYEGLAERLSGASLRLEAVEL